MNIDSNTTIYLNNTEIVQIYDGGGQVIWQKGSTPPTPTPENFYLKNESSSTNSMYFDASKAYGMILGVYYSTDGTNWTYLDRYVTINFSDKLYLKSDDFYLIGADFFANISCTQNFSLGGDITTLSPDVKLYSLFSNNTNLISVSNIDMSNVGNTSVKFSNIFSGCTNLTDCIDLSGVTSGYFENMYNGCSSLNRAVAPTLSSIGNSLNNWLNGVAASGTFYNYYSAIPLNSASGVPSGWTYQPFTISNIHFENICRNYPMIMYANVGGYAQWTDGVATLYNSDKSSSATVTFTPSNVSSNGYLSTGEVNEYFYFENPIVNIHIENNGSVIYDNDESYTWHREQGPC